MTKLPSISLIVPIYNENDDVAEPLSQLKQKLNDLEVPDPQILLTIGKDIGEAFREGLKGSSGEFIGIYSAYNQIDPKSLNTIVENSGAADVVVGFIANPESRPFHRRFFSRLNVLMVNLIFGLNLKYYHFCFFRADLARQVNIFSDSHAAMTEVVVWLLKSGATYIEVPIYLNPHNFPSKSGAFRPTNLIRIFVAYSRLFFLVILMKKRLSF